MKKEQYTLETQDIIAQIIDPLIDEVNTLSFLAGKQGIRALKVIRLDNNLYILQIKESPEKDGTYQKIERFGLFCTEEAEKRSVLQLMIIETELNEYLRSKNWN